MRLLERNSDGDFSMTTDFGDDIPPYAILSHTWGADIEEVGFRDLIDGTGKSKAAYNKIRFCGELARLNGLQYIWVDTCCIDKSNSTELAEAINSMFRWYHNAATCYVYLSDVSSTDFTWESAFRASRWFTRGWTLQELLAPKFVEFFSREGKRLGDKKTLERQVHEITGIPIPALQGAALSQFRVDERLLWVENRQTTRKEDKAYSLLGIFDVYMPLIYGEGSDNAFARLRGEINKHSKGLDDLPYAIEAPFNSFAKQHSSSCLPNTRVELLGEIYGWADRQDERCIFWLTGLAGTGKSTIACTVARRYFEERRLGASFFFTKGGGDVGHAGKFVLSIAVQLANSVPTLRQHICDAVTEQSDIASRSLRDQWHKLVLRPLSKLDSSNCYSSYVLVIDALDECDDNNNIRIILQLLSEARLLQTVRLRVLLTSRPDVPIQHGINQIPDAERQDFILHNVSPSTVDHDISIFLESNLRMIGQERSLGADWPGGESIRRMVQNAGGLFIWAATACRFISEGQRFAAKRLDAIINGSSSAIIAVEENLNEIYVTVLKHSIYSEYTDEERDYQYKMLRYILGSIVVSFSPLSTGSLGRLLHITRQEVDQTLEDLPAILDIPKNQSNPVRLHHPSFRDFLLDNDRCKDPSFQVDYKQAHKTLAGGCIRLMSESLKQYICGLDAPGACIGDIDSSRVERSLPPELQYACLYWIQHLHKSDVQFRDDDQVHQFLQEDLLHWLEALGWMQKISEGIYAIASLQSIVALCECPRLFDFISDTKRFVFYNRRAIEQAPSQTYVSALVFTPSMSLVRKQFGDCIPQWIRRLPEVENNWNALLQTLEGHFSNIDAVAFSPDGKLIASGSDDRTVRLWDVGSGAALQSLEGHFDAVLDVVFSPDGKLLASASFDQTVRLWDAGSGAALQILKGHYGMVRVVAFSPDGKLIASASSDQTVRLWNVGSGAAVQTLEGHFDAVFDVVFSPDGKLLASASSDQRVRLWVVGSGAALQTLEGHSYKVVAAAFSPDGKLLASASYDQTVRLWDVGSGAALQTFQGHSEAVLNVVFSPDGKLLASASFDRTVRLWDAGSGAALQILKGHSNAVLNVVFSPDGKLLASASDDKTVRLWDAGSGVALDTLEGHSGEVTDVTFSPDGKLIASVSCDQTVRLWDAGSVPALQTLKIPVLHAPGGHSNRVEEVAFSPDGKLLASGSVDETVILWDVGSGAALQTLEGHSDTVLDVVFSPDGKLLASASCDKTVRLWDAGSGAALQILKGHSRRVRVVAFSPDGNLLASASADDTVILWNVGSSEALETLEGHSNEVTGVTFSPDGKLIASVSHDQTVRLWDVGSGAALQTLAGHYDWVNAVAFSPDGKLLASGSYDSTIRLWDADSGAALHTFTTNSHVWALWFSDDGKFVQTDSGKSLHIAFLSDGETPSQLNPPCSIFVDDEWVGSDMGNLLWLPFNYRPWCSDIHGSIVGFGCESGRVVFIEFAIP